MKVYLDNNATTKVSKEVLDSMLPFFNEEFGNPSSMHDEGFKIKKMVNGAKKDIAEVLNVDSKEIYFTSSGTEANNFALKGLAYANKVKSEIITTKIEHHSVLHTCKFLETLGYTVHYLDVDQEGFVDLEQLKSLISDNTLVVSIILANNEIGTIQRIRDIKKICDLYSTYLHIDAVQALTHISLDLKAMDVDLASFSGHKINAPKGIGFLYVKDQTRIVSVMHGGQQENSLRSGTENVAYIKGISVALTSGIKRLDEYTNKLNELSNYLLNRLNELEIDYILNGPLVGPQRLAGNLNLSFKNKDSMLLTYLLNKKGIYCSTGSACDTTTIEVSHVIKALNLPTEYSSAVLRVSMSLETTKTDIDYFIEVLVESLKE